MVRIARAGIRIRFVMAIFALGFATIGVRLLQLGLADASDAGYATRHHPAGRPPIVDRNGRLLATDLPSAAVYAEPRLIVDVDEAVEKLTAVLPELDASALYQRLNTKAAFAWIKRQVTPVQQQALWRAGIPAVGFRPEKHRFYPNGTLAAHVLGAVDIDNTGTAGIEKWIDSQGLEDLRRAGMDVAAADLEPVELALDIRVQHALEDEIVKAVGRFEARAGAGLVLDVTNGEILALVSYPGFDPNDPADALKPDRINRITAATFEMGSSFKALTTALALESGKFTIGSVIDAGRPLAFGRFRIHDYMGKYRPLTVPEAFIYSSNIATAKMALAVGPRQQRAFLARFGQTSRLKTELPESAAPILPRSWGEIDAATISFGHGLAVTPLQASMGIAALVNGGRLIRPTFVKGAPVGPRVLDTGLVAAATGEALRFLLRLNAEIGSARNADVPGYFVGGKTGTAEKVVNGRYAKDLNITSFMGVVPANDPRYLLLTILDEPKGSPETHGYRTSGWNAVPLGGAVLERILPMMDIVPSFKPIDDPFPTIAGARAFGSERFANP